MDALLKLVATLGWFNAARRRGTARKYAVVAVCGMLAGSAGIAAGGFCLAALWFAALPQFGPAGSALIIAGTLVVLSLVLAAVAVVVVRRHRKSPTPDWDDATAALSAASRLFSGNKATILLAALIVGAAVGSGGVKAAGSASSDKNSRL